MTKYVYYKSYLQSYNEVIQSNNMYQHFHRNLLSPQITMQALGFLRIYIRTILAAFKLHLKEMKTSYF